MASLLAKQIAIVLLAVVIFTGFMVYSYVTRSFYFAEVLLGPGESTLDYLRGDPYSKMVVEVDHVPTWAPSDQALEVLRQRIMAHTDKVEVSFVLSGELPAGGSPYSPSGLQGLYLRHRNYTTAGNVAALHVAYLDGGLEGRQDAVGVSYTSRSFAVFPEVVARGPVGSTAFRSIEAAVLVHELGHILGLVNLVYQSDQTTLHNSSTPYEDEDHPGHTNNQSDVMYYAVEVALGGTSEPPTDFGFETARDLEGLRTGRLQLEVRRSYAAGPPSTTDKLMTHEWVIGARQIPWPRVSSS